MDMFLRSPPVFSGVRVARSLVFYELLVQLLPCCQKASINEIIIETTSSEISDQLRDIYSICRCCWNVATHKWKVHNGKIENNLFMYMFCRSLFILLYFFLLAVMLPVLLRNTDSDYPFGIFKLLRTGNITAKRKKYKRINNDLQNIYIKLKIE
jgi:hypothetical protein